MFRAIHVYYVKFFVVFCYLIFPILKQKYFGRHFYESAQIIG